MLDPESKRHVADGTEYIASLLHEEIVKIVAEAIVTRMERGVDYRLTARDRWMLELLGDAGYLREALEKEIAVKTRLMLREVQAAFEDAAVENMAWDDEVYRASGLEPTPLRQSPMLMRLAERGYEKTRGELVNFTGTLADASQRLFIKECDKAYTLVASGAMGHAQAVRQAVETAARDGIIVRYPSGHRDTIETATGRAVRTGVGQACGDMTLARMDELDWDTVLVSSHLGARTGDGGDNWTNHYYLQSLGFFSRSGNDKKFKALSVCGIGYVDGLLGANCRHSIGPGDGVHNPYAHYDSEENRLREKLEQRQRLLERRVRDTKRKVQGLKAAMDKAEDPADREELRGRYQQTARKLQRQNRDYNEFCEANELKLYRERLHIAGWNRKQAASATGAARAAEKAAEAELEKYKNYHYNDDGTIVVTDDWTTREHPRLPRKYKPYAVIDTVSQNGKQRDRIIYGPDARQKVQVSNGPHGNPRKHPYGDHGEHAHDIIWEGDKIVGRPAREITNREREEHKDIL